jgi:hypothetical protein
LDTLSLASQFGFSSVLLNLLLAWDQSVCAVNRTIYFSVNLKPAEKACICMYVCMYVCLSECLFWIANNSIYCLTSSIHWHAIYLIGKGIPGDGRCLFRSVVHGALLRAGKSSPSEGHQKELADELRAKVQHKLTFNDFTRRVMLC